MAVSVSAGDPKPLAGIDVSVQMPRRRLYPSTLHHIILLCQLTRSNHHPFPVWVELRNEEKADEITAATSACVAAQSRSMHGVR